MTVSKGASRISFEGELQLMPSKNIVMRNGRRCFIVTSVIGAICLLNNYTTPKNRFNLYYQSFVTNLLF